MPRIPREEFKRRITIKLYESIFGISIEEKIKREAAQAKQEAAQAKQEATLFKQRAIKALFEAGKTPEEISALANLPLYRIEKLLK